MATRTRRPRTVSAPTVPHVTYLGPAAYTYCAACGAVAPTGECARTPRVLDGGRVLDSWVRPIVNGRPVLRSDSEM